MTEADWLYHFRQNVAVLEQFVAQYHPASHDFSPAELPISATGAESVSVVCRDQIKENTKTDPQYEFKAALACGDVDALYSMLNGAWFGVPESASCWSVPGFREAVRLLEDPPEIDEE